MIFIVEHNSSVRSCQVKLSEFWPMICDQECFFQFFLEENTAESIMCVCINIYVCVNMYLNY